VTCPFTQSTYKPEHKGKLCSTCGMTEVGAKTLGVKFRDI
jgi:hypothetical protein